jgi:hypothetical protein
VRTAEIESGIEAQKTEQLRLQLELQRLHKRPKKEPGAAPAQGRERPLPVADNGGDDALLLTQARSGRAARCVGHRAARAPLQADAFVLVFGVEPGSSVRPSERDGSAVDRCPAAAAPSVRAVFAAVHAAVGAGRLLVGARFEVRRLSRFGGVLVVYVLPTVADRDAAPRNGRGTRCVRDAVLAEQIRTFWAQYGASPERPLTEAACARAAVARVCALDEVAWVAADYRAAMEMEIGRAAPGAARPVPPDVVRRVERMCAENAAPTVRELYVLLDWPTAATGEAERGLRRGVFRRLADALPARSVGRSVGRLRTTDRAAGVRERRPHLGPGEWLNEDRLQDAAYLGDARDAAVVTELLYACDFNYMRYCVQANRADSHA